MALTPVFNHKKTQFLMAPEPTMGTAVTLLASHNDMRVIPDSISFEPEIEEWLNWFASGRHSLGQSTMGKRKAALKFQAPLILGASAGVAPKLGKAFKACGQTETIVASTSVAYTPDATKDQGDNVNVTIGVIFVPTSGSALLCTMKGAIGNCKIMMTQSGYPLLADFDFLGAWVGVSDGSALALTSPDSGYAPNTIGTDCTMAAIVQQIAKMELDFGNALELDEYNGDPTGYGCALIGSRAPKLSYDPRARTQAVDPVFQRLIDSTQQPFFMGTAASAGLKYEVSAPKCQASGMKFAKRGSILAWDQSFWLQENAGNDAHKILQLAA